MFMNLGDVAAGSTLYCPFATYNAAGASVTITGLAATDIEIYKNGSVTQRASDAGYTLLDTDGIDFDAITGIHGFSVDLSDNTTAGFYTAGSAYWIVVSAITVDSQTVNFGYYFTIRRDVTSAGTLSGTHSSTTADLGTLAPANDISGQTLNFPGHGLSRIIDSYNTGTGVATFSPSVAVTLTNGDLWTLFPTPPGSTGAPLSANVTQWLGTAAATPTVAGVPEVDATHYLGAAAPALVGGRFDSSTGAMAANVLTATAINADAITAAKVAADVGTEIATAVGTRAIPDSYAADGAQPTIEQAILGTLQVLTEAVVSGSTILIKKPDGTTNAMIITCSPSVAAATSRTRTT